MPGCSQLNCRWGLRTWFAVTVIAAWGCGNVPPAGPEYEIEEARFSTPAGTEHVMVRVPSGSFRMGSEDGPDNERPVHEVFLDAFYIDKYEVTNAQYLAFAEAAGYEQPEYLRVEAFRDPDQPVVALPWPYAKAYCEWAGMKLPSEAQWEKAARGIDGRTYPWGNEAPDETRGCFNASDHPVVVGTYPDGVSPYGAHDMAGNVWEWTYDEYAHTFYYRSSERNPVNLESAGEEEGPDRTLRGGGWLSPAHHLRASIRSTLLLMEEYAVALGGGDEGLITSKIGFRCVQTIEKE